MSTTIGVGECYDFSESDVEVEMSSSEAENCADFGQGKRNSSCRGCVCVVVFFQSPSNKSLYACQQLCRGCVCVFNQILYDNCEMGGSSLMIRRELWATKQL